MTRPKLIIGSRGSPLALHQAHWVKTRLEQSHPELPVAIEVIKTSGDIILDAPLSTLGGKGVFTKEIEEALLARKIDLAVHSMKDLPTALPEGLCLGAVSSREDVRDAFLSNHFESIGTLPNGARVGTSSLRRQSQLLQIRKDLLVVNLRGNLDTRIRKLDEGQYDAILLACAGLVRLGLSQRIKQRIPIDLLCPAVGQGALGIEVREKDGFVLELIEGLHDRKAARAVLAERTFLQRLGGGCQVPIAAHAWEEDGGLQMLGVVASLDGSSCYRSTDRAPFTEAELLGARLAEKLLSLGAQEIVDVISTLNPRAKNLAPVPPTPKK
jgi:hydroxymethylbilane synthase